MISVEDALRLVLQNCPSPTTESVGLSQATGRVLAQDVTADRDLPPFDRVTMDGIAIQAEVFLQGQRYFKIEGVQAAGAPALSLKSPNDCLEVMTGAVLPAYTNAIVPYEQCEINDGVALVTAEQVKPRQFIHNQGTDAKTGTVLVKKGTRITSSVIGILASVGFADVPVLALPRVAICSTGDELVEIDQWPLPHQIRKSNAYMLAAEVQEENIYANLFHLPDEPEEMLTALQTIIEQHDVILLSGAVSKGKFDFLPKVLERLQLSLIFHKIAQKPGKPMLFGKLPEDKMVFGFPGNPVSTFVCYHLYFRPWLNGYLGLPMTEASAVLTEDIDFAPALAYHVPVSLSIQKGTLSATPINGSGSGDLTSILSAHGLVTLPAEQRHFKAGDAFPVTLFPYAFR